jgi:hypothetical protein
VRTARRVTDVPTIVYDLALRSLDQQERELAELRSRTNTVIAAAALIASFLAGRAAFRGDRASACIADAGSRMPAPRQTRRRPLGPRSDPPQSRRGIPTAPSSRSQPHHAARRGAGISIGARQRERRSQLRPFSPPRPASAPSKPAMRLTVTATITARSPGSPACLPCSSRCRCGVTAG